MRRGQNQEAPQCANFLHVLPLSEIKIFPLGPCSREPCLSLIWIADFTYAIVFLLKKILFGSVSARICVKNTSTFDKWSHCSSLKQNFKRFYVIFTILSTLVSRRAVKLHKETHSKEHATIHRRFGHFLNHIMFSAEGFTCFRVCRFKPGVFLNIHPSVSYSPCLSLRHLKLWNKYHCCTSYVNSRDPWQ